MENKKGIRTMAIALLLCSVVMCLSIFVISLPHWFQLSVSLVQMILVCVIVYKTMRQINVKREEK